MTLETRRWHEYQGETLCPCCGNNGSGVRYEICADKSMKLLLDAHALSCERYRYGSELCEDCDSEGWEIVD